MDYVNVREFKNNATRYLNSGREIVITRRREPVAVVAPVPKRSLERALLRLGQVFQEAGITRQEALKALDKVRGALAREYRS